MTTRSDAHRKILSTLIVIISLTSQAFGSPLDSLTLPSSGSLGTGSLGLPSLPASGGGGLGGSDQDTALDQTNVRQAQMESATRQGSDTDFNTDDPTKTNDQGNFTAGGGEAGETPYIDPIGGAASAQNDQGLMSVLASSFSKKVTLYMATLGLTEPGLATAAAAGMTAANGIVGNQIAAETALVTNHKGHSASQEASMDARSKCITTQSLLVGISSAISLCSGGVYLAPDLGGTYNLGKQTTQLDNRNHSRYQDPLVPNFQMPEPASPCPGQNEICATDYIFNQELRRLTGSMSFGSVVSPELQQTIDETMATRRDMLNIVGDIRYTVETKPGNVLSWQVSYVPPLDAVSGDKKIADQKRMRYLNFNDLMKKYCSWYVQTCDGSDTCGPGQSREDLLKNQYPTESGGISLDYTSGDIRDFWRDSKDGKRLRAKLSTSMFIMQPKVIEDLFTIYKTDSVWYQRGIANSSLTGKDGACGGFYAGSGEPADYDKLYPPSTTTSLGGALGAITPALGDNFVNKNTPWHTALKTLSDLIGEAQYLDVLGQWGASIHTTLYSSATMESAVRNDMLTLLNNQAIRRSKTGSLTIDQEMYTRAKQIQAAIITMILGPAKDNLATSVASNQESLKRAGERSNNNTEATH